MKFTEVQIQLKNIAAAAHDDDGDEDNNNDDNNKKTFYNDDDDAAASHVKNQNLITYNEQGEQAPP